MDIKKCMITDANYPKKLLSLASAPKTLYFIGDISIANKDIIAVIGKREANKKSLSLSEKIGHELAKKEFVVLNGLAIGCDTKAIEGALLGNGKVIAVMPCGLDEIYPKSNRMLAEKIIKTGGCIISEYPCSSKPQRYTFVERDRLQAGLADKVIVIDAEIKGGTMHTVNYALKLKKEIGCIMEENEITPKGNEYLCKSQKCDALNSIHSVLNFVKKPVYSQVSLFNET